MDAGKCKRKQRVVIYLDWGAFINVDQVAGLIAEKIFPLPKRRGDYEDKEAVQRYKEEKNQWQKFVSFCRANPDVCRPFPSESGDLIVTQKELRAYFRTTDFVLEIRESTWDDLQRKCAELAKRKREEYN